VLLRFVGPDIDPRTGQPTGLMTLAYELGDSGDINHADAMQLHAHLEWIQKTIPIPTRFARRRNGYHKETHGLSWVKAEAGEFVRHLHAIADILARYDTVVVRTARPGYIVYEDDWQVVAEPFHGESR
jgi:hypothetical protein